MIVELYGPPGSGKTSAAHILSGTLHVPIVDGTTMPSGILDRVVALMKWPRVSWHVLIRSWYASRAFSGVSWLSLCSLALARMARYRHMRRIKTLVLLDEGPFQNVVSLAYHGLSMSSVLNHLRALPKGHHLLVFDIPKEERRRRIERRSAQRRPALSQEDRLRWYDAMESVHQTVLASLSSLGVPYTVIKNESDLMLYMKVLAKSRS